MAVFKLTTGIAYVRGWTGTVTAGTAQFADGAVGSPSMTFATAPTNGFYLPSASSIGVSVQGTEYVRFGGGFTLKSNATIQWASSTIGTTADSGLFLDAAATIALRNGTTAQAFRVYNTFTDTSNYERGVFGFASNVLRIGTEKAGTGASRVVDFLGNAGFMFRVGGAETATWQISVSGHLLATDNTYDIGASGATRPRSIYAGTFVRVAAAVSAYQCDGQMLLGPSADGVVRISNAAGTDFGRLCFGGTTSSFPAIKRGGNGLQVRLADDSAASGLGVGALHIGANTTLLLTQTAPTIASGFGTSPSIPSNNGSMAFTVNVGTGGTASSGVITMPAALTGWIVRVENMTANAANRANVATVQTATTTTSVTIQNQTVSTGAAVAWSASDVLNVIAVAY